MEFHAGLQYLDSIFGVPKKLSIIFRGQQRNSGMDPPVLKVREYPPWGQNRLNWLRTQGRGAKASRNISRMRKAISVIPFHMMVQFVRISQNAALTN